MMQVSDLRKEYTLQTLDEKDVSPDPFVQFDNWLKVAVDAQLPEPTAMNLATVSPEGKPSGRIVLLKGFDNQGFTFYSNYQSHKGKDMETNPFVALTFYWVELERQVRIAGKVEKVSREKSDAYFHSRPRASQIGAFVSPQSQTLPDREFLENETEKIKQLFENQEIPLPENWGGYTVKPDWIEFWQGRRSRLHDRILYRWTENEWKIERLAP